ncbi:MAG: VOC family protein [Phycisphaerales bacterium]|nr:VOC family protein [Phycisphaerales bacterium]
MTARTFADKVQMQHRLFAELSAMFGKEVPLYDKSLLVNRVCNRAVCDLLGKMYPSFRISDAQLEKTSGERHGAIRIGRADEYRWIARFFAAFAMEPHNFYDMTSVGAKSQPIIASAFRSTHNPEHRVFTSLLQTDWFDAATRGRIEALLAGRRVFGETARALIEKGERQGGLDWADAEALIREGTTRIFKWTGRARDHALYKELCDAGFKIAADIACFESHHLNHLTPNTLCMDLYTSAMKFCMGEIDEASFRPRAERALAHLERTADGDWMRLHFKHLDAETIEGWPRQGAGAAVAPAAAALTERLKRPDLRLGELRHSGFKDTTEGPSEDTPVLLRQDSYKALTEPVEFVNADGSVVKTTHTARFGEIEQRFYATTPAGRSLYDRCLAEAEAAGENDPGLAARDFAAYKARYAQAFAPFPKTLPGLLDAGLVYAHYSPTAKGLAARGRIATTDARQLVRLGYARAEGLRYEDFLPVSAAGIFASNLNQYGTKSTAVQRPVYTQAMLENVMGKRIIDTDAAYRGAEARSLLDTYERLGLLESLASADRAALEASAANAAGAPAAAMAAV